MHAHAHSLVAHICKRTSHERVSIAEQDDASQADRQERVEDAHQRTYLKYGLWERNNESVRLGAADKHTWISIAYDLMHQ